MSYAYLCVGPDDEARMRDEDAFLIRQLEEVIRSASANDSAACEQGWEFFVRELESHLHYEEHLLFPTFERCAPAQESPIGRLRMEHDNLRSQCRELGIDLSQPARCAERLDRLVHILAAHQEHEGGVFYPWLISLGHPRFSWEGMHTPAVLRSSLGGPAPRVIVRSVED